MKKLIKRSTVLLFSCLISYAAIIFIIISLGVNNWFPGNEILTGNGFTLSKTREIKKYSNLDVLFLGSSNVLRGVDTRLFEESGIKAFNMGTYSQSAYNSYYLLKEYISVVKPKHVVLDLYWPVISGDGTESTVDIVSNHQLTYNMIEMAVRTHNMLTIRNLIAVALSRLRKPLASFQVKEDYLCKYIPGGFVATSYIDTVKKNQQFARVSRQLKLPLDMQLEYLNKIIALCKATNIKLMMILVPVSREFKNSLKNYDGYTNTISAIAKRNNVAFVDYNQNYKLNLSSINDYSDINHMNSYGATKFTKLLLRDFNNMWHKKRNSIAINEHKAFK